MIDAAYLAGLSNSEFQGVITLVQAEINKRQQAHRERMLEQRKRNAVDGTFIVSFDRVALVRGSVVQTQHGPGVRAIETCGDSKVRETEIPYTWIEGYPKEEYRQRFDADLEEVLHEALVAMLPDGTAATWYVDHARAYVALCTSSGEVRDLEFAYPLSAAHAYTPDEISAAIQDLYGPGPYARAKHAQDQSSPVIAEGDYVTLSNAADVEHMLYDHDICNGIALVIHTASDHIECQVTTITQDEGGVYGTLSFAPVHLALHPEQFRKATLEEVRAFQNNIIDTATRILLLNGDDGTTFSIQPAQKHFTLALEKRGIIRRLKVEYMNCRDEAKFTGYLAGQILHLRRQAP